MIITDGDELVSLVLMRWHHRLVLFATRCLLGVQARRAAARPVHSRAAASANKWVSLVTWNLLAPCFVSPSKYPWAGTQALDWQHRHERILSQLARLDADVVCLQEVERASWDRLNADFHELGYDSVLQQSTSNVENPIANVVLLRRGQLELVRAESRSRALITVLQAAGASDEGLAEGEEARLYLANVHFEAGADKAAQRQFQLNSLLKRLVFQRSLDVAAASGRPRALAPSSDASGAPIVIAGDFNCDRRSPLYTFLSEGVAADETKQTPSSAQVLLPLTDAYSSAPPPWGSAQPHRIPSIDHPSDHMPLGALISWAGAPVEVSGQRPAWQQLYVENVIRGDNNFVSG
ncbi:hypothetical protein AB1Y20_001765 [Prymnesium parvum]|uniref:Endonuclease/exonuclease/phosphatase domain-containing protein n=1 Tax=Prymnesium parvum TaxID=97485 RepID=A0AB34K993_PRYPA